MPQQDRIWLQVTSDMVHGMPWQAAQGPKQEELADLAALRQAASFGPETPGRTEDSAREAFRAWPPTGPSAAPRRRLEAALVSPPGSDLHAVKEPIVRADSAQEVPAKRRAVGQSPFWSRKDQV